MIGRVSNIIKFDVQSFFEQFIVFATQHRQLISDYYTNGIVYPKSSFDALATLKSYSKIISEKISSNRDYLTNFSDFEVVDKIEEVNHTLEIIDNYSRWLRSSLFKGRFKDSAEINVILRQNQTLESFSEEVGYLDKDKGTIDIAVRNSIKETDTTLDGGVVFRFSYQDKNGLALSSIVDNLSGDNLLGKDISQKLTFTLDDLQTLSPYDTFLQTCSILISLLKKDNPEFPNIGFDKSTISNKNIMNNMLPSFIRQLYNTASQDDSIANFTVSNIFMAEDVLNIEVTFKSWLNNEVKQTVNGN